MCLIIFAYRVHPEFPLLLAANRDEFYARPTAPSAFWNERPELLAGRDKQAGGTWMGVTRGGRFAAVTNFRDPARTEPAPRSRGELPLDWLLGAKDASDWLAGLDTRRSEYAGFNLLIGDGDGLWYYSNAGARGPRQLAPGVYGLSNASLNTPWPKVELGKARMAALLSGTIDHSRLLRTVHDRHVAAAEDLHSHGLRESMDQLLSPQFIQTEQYGTRSSTSILWHDSGHISWRECSYGVSTAQNNVVEEDLQLPPAGSRM